MYVPPCNYFNYMYNIGNELLLVTQELPTYLGHRNSFAVRGLEMCVVLLYSFYLVYSFSIFFYDFLSCPCTFLCYFALFGWDNISNFEMIQERQHKLCSSTVLMRTIVIYSMYLH